MKSMTPDPDHRREPKPKPIARLKQCNKSNRLLRRYYAGLMAAAALRRKEGP